MLRLSSVRPVVILLLAGIASAGVALAQETTGIHYARIPAGAYAVVAEVRAERNNLLYFLHEERESPGHFVFYEIFASQADFEAHNRTPHVQAWFARLQILNNGDRS